MWGTAKKKMKVAFVVEHPVDYNLAMASTRLRCYDVINYLTRHGVEAEKYDGSKDYDIVIFQKAYSEKYRKMAERIKGKGTVVILDMNINIIERFGEFPVEQPDQHTEDIKKMLPVADYILVSAQNLLEVYSKYHSSVLCIEENVTDNFFKVKKHHKGTEGLKLLYSGYSHKAGELQNIKDVIKTLHKETGATVLAVCEKDPGLEGIVYEYKHYDQAILPEILLEGDIKIAPRDTGNSYNLGHSFNKVAYPMSVGIPAVASPVPSYLNREVIICRNDEDWYRELKNLISSPGLRNYYGLRSMNFVKANFSHNVIGKQYIELFDFIIHNKG